MKKEGLQELQQTTIIFKMATTTVVFFQIAIISACLSCLQGCQSDAGHEVPFETRALDSFVPMMFENPLPGPAVLASFDPMMLENPLQERPPLPYFDPMLVDNPLANFIRRVQKSKSSRSVGDAMMGSSLGQRFQREADDDAPVPYVSLPVLQMLHRNLFLRRLHEESGRSQFQVVEDDEDGPAVQTRMHGRPGPASPQISLRTGPQQPQSAAAVQPSASTSDSQSGSPPVPSNPPSGLPVVRGTGCGRLPDPGHCRGAFPRFYYNAKLDQCDCFFFGGCGEEDEEATFCTLEECHNRCLPGNRTEGPYCPQISRMKPFGRRECRAKKQPSVPDGPVGGGFTPPTVDGVVGAPLPLPAGDGAPVGPPLPPPAEDGPPIGPPLPPSVSSGGTVTTQATTTTMIATSQRPSFGQTPGSGFPHEPLPSTGTGKPDGESPPVNIPSGTLDPAAPPPEKPARGSGIPSGGEPSGVSPGGLRPSGDESSPSSSGESSPGGSSQGGFSPPSEGESYPSHVGGSAPSGPPPPPSTALGPDLIPEDEFSFAAFLRWLRSFTGSGRTRIQRHEEIDFPLLYMMLQMDNPSRRRMAFPGPPSPAYVKIEIDKK